MYVTCLGSCGVIGDYAGNELAHARKHRKVRPVEVLSSLSTAHMRAKKQNVVVMTISPCTWR